MCNFTGITIDVLLGLIYLIKKYPNSCSTTPHNFIVNKNLCMHYKLLGIRTNLRCEFFNFEIVWIDNKIFFTDNFKEHFIKCHKKSNVRFIIIPLGIEMKEGNHANYIIYDKALNEIERFEPYGEIYFANCFALNQVLEEELANKLEYKFIFIQSYPGFQIRSDEFNEKNKSYGDPGGFCLAWCFLYLEIKLYYEYETLKKMNRETRELVEKIEDDEQVIKLINNYVINNFEEDFPNLKTDEQNNLYMTFIRYYARGLDKAKNELIRSYGLNVSTIYHLDLDDKIHKKIIYNLNNDISNINKKPNNL
jgi:hypothetical protein